MVVVCGSGGASHCHRRPVPTYPAERLQERNIYWPCVYRLLLRGTHYGHKRKYDQYTPPPGLQDVKPLIGLYCSAVLPGKYLIQTYGKCKKIEVVPWVYINFQYLLILIILIFNLFTA